MRLSKAQAVVLVRMLKNNLLRCDHVRLQDGVSYFFRHFPDENNINCRTVYRLLDLGLIESTKPSEKKKLGDFKFTQKGLHLAIDHARRVKEEHGKG